MEKIEEKQMLECLTKQVQERLETLNNNFDYIEKELVEYYIYEIKALGVRYDYLIKQLKEI